MAWSAAQKNILSQSFSYHNEQHRALIREKLAQFQKLKTKQQQRNKHVGLGLIIGLGASWFGPNLFIIHSSNAVYLALGAYIWASQASHQRYMELFDEMRDIYDWCIPDGSSLPVVDNVLMQQLIETLGMLLDSGRIQRLSPLVNGERTSNALSHYASGGVHALFGTVKNLMFNVSEETEQQLMQPEVFSLLVRQLVQGKSSSMLDFYLYGQGRQSVDGYIKRGLSLVPSQVKEAFNESEEPACSKSI